MTQTVDVSAGAAELTWPLTLTERNGVDISADPVQLSLGTFTSPGAWVTPTIDQPQTNKAQRVVQLLVGTGTTKGAYYLWVRIADAPETVIRRAGQIKVT